MLMNKLVRFPLFLLGLLVPSAAFAAGGHEHWSVFMEIIPKETVSDLQHLFAPSVMNPEATVVTISHVLFACVTFVLGLGMMIAANRKLRREDDYLLPPAKMSAFAFFDVLVEMLLSTMERMMTREQAMRFVPLIATFSFFILVSNLMGLIPGMLPPTDSLNTTLALGLVAFLAYNYWGIRQQGFVKYMKHFMGPIWWLTPLMFPIEIVSHMVRPCSLALRLMGNMFGDHKVLGIFLAFNLVLLPLPLMALGMLVCVVQTLVFTLLAIVYVALAVEEHDDHDHAEAH
jgi:F-type H+-transporting ATPase subunit a